MRIKAYVISTRKIINIQNVKIKYHPDHVIVAFDCHRKYEDDLWGADVIFVNHKYKELFRGTCRVSFLYYQSDGRKPKVQFEVYDPYVKYGNVSAHYINKFIQKKRKKKVEESPPVPKEPYYPFRYGPGIMRYYERVIAFKHRAKYIMDIHYRNLHRIGRYINPYIHPLDITYEVDPEKPP